MAVKSILDIHALVWYLEGNPRLGREAKTIMSATNSEMVLPLIALAEAAFLIEKGRIYLQDMGHTVSILTKDETITSAGVLPVIW